MPDCTVGLFRWGLKRVWAETQVCKCTLDLRCALQIVHFSVSKYMIFLPPWKILHQSACTSEQFLLQYYHSDSWTSFSMNFKLNNYTTSYHAFQHSATPTFLGVQHHLRTNMLSVHLPNSSIWYVPAEMDLHLMSQTLRFSIFDFM